MSKTDIVERSDERAKVDMLSKRLLGLGGTESKDVVDLGRTSIGLPMGGKEPPRLEGDAGCRPKPGCNKRGPGEDEEEGPMKTSEAGSCMTCRLRRVIDRLENALRKRSS